MSKEKIKIEHHRGNDFSSHYASGMIITGPTADGLFQIHFFMDTKGIVSETGVPIDEDGIEFKVTLGEGDMIQFREDKARISLSKLTLINLQDVIGRHLAKLDTVEVEGSEDGE